MSHPQPFLDVARYGKNRWWHYLLGVAIIFFVWFLLGSLPVGLAMAAGARPDSLLYLAAALFSFAFAALGLFLAQSIAHQRPFLTVINPSGRFDLRRFLQGFAVWFALAAAQGVVEALLHPGRYVFSFNAAAWLSYLLPLLILIPIQAGAEELLLRGYLLQGLGQKLRNPFLLVFISGALFSVLHLGNPEISINLWLLLAYYLSFGCLMAWVTLKDQSLELAMGAHIANNLYTALLANYVAVSAMPTPAVWMIQELDAVYGLLAFLVGGAIFYWVFFGQPALGQTGRNDLQQGGR